MVIDGNAISEPSLSADVVVIGTGIAGSTLALRLAEQGRSVILVESGDWGVSGKWAVTLGAFDYFKYSASEDYAGVHIRREVGGASSVWGGWCSVPRPIDFARPEFGPTHQWPLALKDLTAQYVRAGEYLELANIGFALEPDFPLPGAPHIRAKGFDFSPPLRVMIQWADRLRNAANIRLIYNTTVDQLEPGVGSVARCSATTKAGKPIALSARHYVIAGGAVGNARILARSRLSIPPAARRNLGRYLTEHPHVYGAARCILRPEVAAAFAHKNLWSRDFISLTVPQHELAALGTPDFNLQIRPASDTQLTEQEKVLAANYAAVFPAAPVFYDVTIGMEQLPDPANSALASEEVATGALDGALRLVFGETERRTLRAAMRWLRETVAHQVITKSQRMVGVGHLHGTTRMAGSPQYGVVDRDCAVFGVGNLHVAGSSVMPTTGFVNPTLTLTALACRLADRLAGAAP